MKHIAIALLLLQLTVEVLAIPRQSLEGDEIYRFSDRNNHQDLPKLQAKVDDAEYTTDYWIEHAKKVLDEQLKKQPNTNKAKNIIFFLGDGLSHPTIAATRVYMGGEEKKLSFEEFPYTASSKTYCVNRQVADSACTSTAYLHGKKAMGSTLGLNAGATSRNCLDTMDPTKKSESIGKWAQDAGKSAGIVTTTRVTHASPAGLYAGISSRYWEDDYSIRADSCDPDYVDDITEQLVHGEVGKKLKVIFGGGSRHFINETERLHGARGYRSDGKNLLEEWKQMDETRTYVDDRSSFISLDPSKVDQVLGLFHTSHCPYNLNVIRDDQQEIYPSLQEMTEKAIDILSKNEEGYFLFVEGGRIDHGHHETRARYALDETAEFSKAIEAAVKRVNTSETLIVVSADHSHAFTISGYAARGNDIFGIAGTGADDLPYTTLSYANGPGFYTHWKYTDGGGRVDIRNLDMTPVNARFAGALPRSEETHGGDDVGIWAIGPWAHLYQGTLEQHVIPHIMAYASCIGPGLKSCD